MPPQQGDFDGMGAVAIQQMADRVAALLEERLALRGDGLEAKLRRGRRMMPRRVFDAATRLAEAAHQSQNPKLLLQIEMGQVTQDYDTCLRHLGGLSLWDRRKVIILRWTASMVLTLIVVGVLFVVVLKWRGLA
ncbi:MAG: hypothetical protein ACK4GO_02990 [Gemmobacter sp.]